MVLILTASLHLKIPSYPNHFHYLSLHLQIVAYHDGIYLFASLHSQMEIKRKHFILLLLLSIYQDSKHSSWCMESGTEIAVECGSLRLNNTAPQNKQVACKPI